MSRAVIISAAGAAAGALITGLSAGMDPRAIAVGFVLSPIAVGSIVAAITYRGESKLARRIRTGK